MLFAAALVMTILTVISALHLYWACGGRWGATAVIPEHHGKPAFQPGVAVTLAVAALLAAAATLIALDAELLQWPLVPSWIPMLATWVIGAVFLLRAVGDFRRVGFFKRVRAGRFAQLDDALFSPLCALLAVGCLVVALRV